MLFFEILVKIKSIRKREHLQPASNQFALLHQLESSTVAARRSTAAVDITRFRQIQCIGEGVHF